MAREIPLANGRGVAIVDDEDYALVAGYRWYRSSRGYAVRDVQVAGRRTGIRMHREILGAPHGLQVDHINHNRLDNRRANLRLATPSQNQANRRPRLRVAHAKGVSYHKTTRKWQAKIQIAGRQIWLGLHRTEAEAAAAYDAAARELFGAFACTNGAAA